MALTPRHQGKAPGKPAPPSPPVVPWAMVAGMAAALAMVATALLPWEQWLDHGPEEAGLVETLPGDPQVNDVDQVVRRYRLPDAARSSLEVVDQRIYFRDHPVEQKQDRP